MKKLEAERLPIFHQWKDRNNLSFNNLDGNLRTSNRKTNSFLPGIAHAVPLSTTEIGSLWGAGEFSYQSCDIIGCRRELLVPWAQGTWGKKLLRDETLGTAFLPHFHCSHDTPFTFIFIAKHEEYENVYFSVMKPKKLHSPTTHFIHNFPLKPPGNFSNIPN